MEKTYPLHKAIRYRNVVKIKILLSLKDINEKNECGYTALLYACEQENNDDMLEVLFERKDIDPFATDNENQNAVHILAFKGQLSWIERFFEKFPNVPVDAVTVKKNTPLIEATKMNHADIIEYLYKRGANINHQNDKSFTALHYAANNGYMESTKKLIELGAQMNQEDDRGCTPLMKSCSWGFIETCKMLLKNGAHVEPKSKKTFKTPLVQAIQRGHLEAVKILLEYGANPNYEVSNDFLTYTPLRAACQSKNLDAMKILIKKGADVNFPGPFSQAVFVCVKKDFYKGLEELVNAGVDLKGRHTQSGRTALETAIKLKKSQMISLLQKYV